jgi:hypothetical protein
VDRAADAPGASREARAGLRGAWVRPALHPRRDGEVHRLPALVLLSRRVERDLHAVLRPALRAAPDRRFP